MACSFIMQAVSITLPLFPTSQSLGELSGDLTGADFSQGTLSESGAKIWISSSGDVRLLDCLDFNGDGYLDLVFGSSGTQKVNSYIYWGSPTKKFLPSSRTELAVTGANGVSVADLNGDGKADLIVSSLTSFSPILFNSGAGKFISPKIVQLPTTPSVGNAVADLNADGHLDIVFANYGHAYAKKANSFIYWGSKSGYSAGSRLELPTGIAINPTVADLDRDGHLDIVFGNVRDSAGNRKTNSYVYWGDPKGYLANTPLELPTVGVSENTVADLNNDGYLDVVFANHSDLKTNDLNSYVYWGSSSGYKTTARGELPTRGASGVSAADLNGDTFLDLVFSNLYSGYSYIYWGSKAGYTTAKRTALPTLHSYGNLVADLNKDTYLDVVFSNQSAGSGLTAYDTNSYIYWGSGSGFSVKNRNEVPTHGTLHGLITDPGSVYDRSQTQHLISRVHDTGAGAPTYDHLKWHGTIPSGGSMAFQLRSAASPASLQSAAWLGFLGAKDTYKPVPGKSIHSRPINQAHNGQRYIQYRVTLGSVLGTSPALSKVEISYH